MLVELLGLFSIIIVLYFITVIVNAQDDDVFTRGKEASHKKGYVMMLYGPRGGYTSTIADMLCKTANTNLADPDIDSWHVIHQSRYYKPYHILIRDVECNGRVYTPSDDSYHEIINYDTIHAINVDSMINDIKMYRRSGINVIVEGHIFMDFPSYNEIPHVFVSHTENDIIEFNNTQHAAGIHAASDVSEAIIKKYIMPVQNVSPLYALTGPAHYFGGEKINAAGVNIIKLKENTAVMPQDAHNVLRMVYNEVYVYFNRIRKQDEIRDLNKVFIHPTILPE